MIKPVRILIVGGNASGCAAAAKAKRFNPNADVLLFEATEFISTG
ncbi:MAG: NAD(P)-binding protein, partial [Ignavibacteriales bacterium]